MAAIELYSTPLFNDANLVAYYRLENANDSKGSFNLTNHNTVAFNPAMFGNGADSGSTNSNKYLDIASNLGITSGNITLNCWMKMDTDVASGYYFTPVNHADVGTFVKYMIEYSSPSGTPQLVAHRYVGGVVDSLCSYNFTIGTTTFHMVTLTYDGTNVILYVDGVSKAQVASSGNGNANVPANQFSLIDPGTSSHFFTGILDEVSVFSRALTATEVSNLYNGTWGIPNKLYQLNQAINRASRW